MSWWLLDFMSLAEKKISYIRWLWPLLYMFTIVILKSKEKIYFHPLRNLFLSIKNWIRITSLFQNLGVAYFPYSSPLNVSNSSKWDWHTNHNLMSFNAISLPPTDIIVCNFLSFFLNVLDAFCFVVSKQVKP